ncbi:MAG: DUF72 domain-containing protein [Kofleriaceae bacterium]|nr:DUF72 domain-containing protein [Kofleriaceae bacterium]MCL4224702.1 DUF72 domain-containing protein [Myxococcales bacterium]
MRFLVGTSGFAYPQWRGRFYPDELADDDLLGYYAARLRAVEINNTFYRMPKREVVARWRAQAGPSFRFVWKASRRISHQAKLKGAEAVDAMGWLWKMAEPLGEQLGPVLLQTPPWLKKDAGLLREFVAAAVPAGRAVAFELTSSSWDDDEIDQVLADHGCGRCIADRADGSARLVRTAPWLYVRLRADDYADDALRGWCARLRALGGDEAWVFFKHEDTARGVELAQAMQAMADAGAGGAADDG